MPCSPAASHLAARASQLTELDFARARRRGPARRRAAGFAWLRDLAAAAVAREGRAARRGARRALAARPRHPRRRGLAARSVGRAHPLLDRLRALHPVEPRRRLPLGLAQHARRAARGISTPLRTRPRPACRGSPPGRAWSPPACWSRAASAARRARRGRAGAGAGRRPFDDGGLISRSPTEQALLVDRLGLLRARLFRRQADACPTRSKPPRRRRWRRCTA